MTGAFPQTIGLTSARPKLSPEQEEALSTFQLGQRLLQTVSTAGWQDIQELMRQMVAATEHDLKHHSGVGPDAKDEIFWLHSRARTADEFVTKLQENLTSIIEAARQAVSPQTEHFQINQF